MEKITNLVQENQITSYLVMTFGLSLIAFSFMYMNHDWQSPENSSAIPVWLLAVYSPTISALILWKIQGSLHAKIKTAISLPSLSPWLLILLIPIAVLLMVLLFHSNTNEFSLLKVRPQTIALLIFLNLALGPLGEEAGWRGFLLPSLQPKSGWLGASLLIGMTWTLWHAALWIIDSPQAEINFFIFTGHVFCYSVLMSILYIEAKGS